MTDKEVIIDGVNVAGCEYLLSTGYCKIQTVFQQNGNEKPYGNFLECHFCKDCYYKQLQRLQAENKELKEKYKWFDHYKDSALFNKDLCNKKSDEIDRYKQALEEIKGIWGKDEDGDYDFIKFQTLNVINEVLKDE